MSKQDEITTLRKALREILADCDLRDPIEVACVREIAEKALENITHDENIDPAAKSDGS